MRALATQYHIKLIEDVAIAFGSKYQGKPLGAWGDAAPYFSTDHSKPLNSLIGGMLYTTDENLYERIFLNIRAGRTCRAKNSGSVGTGACGRDNFTPARYRWHNFAALFDGCEAPFTFSGCRLYPMGCAGRLSLSGKDARPVLTNLGLEALRQWHVVADERRHWFKKISEVFYRNNCQGMIPAGFQNIGEEVVPLRFAFCLPAPAGRYVKTNACGGLSTRFFRQAGYGFRNLWFVGLPI